MLRAQHGALERGLILGRVIQCDQAEDPTGDPTLYVQHLIGRDTGRRDQISCPGCIVKQACVVEQGSRADEAVSQGGASCACTEAALARDTGWILTQSSTD